MSTVLVLPCPYLSPRISPFSFQEKPQILLASTQLSFPQGSRIELKFSNGKHLTFFRWGYSVLVTP